MSEIEIGKIKHGGLFGPSEKIIFEFKYERPTAEGEIKSISLYKEADGEHLGKVEYINNGSTVKLNVFNIMNWSSEKYASALMDKFLKEMRKKKAQSIIHEMYDTDDKTHHKLTLFRDTGFEVENRGNITGYNQYYLKLNLY